MAELTMKIGVNSASLKKGLKTASGSLKEFGRRSKLVAKDFRRGMERNLTSITMMNPAIGQLSLMLGSASKAFKILTKGTTLFKTALMGTGIGLIVVAFGALYTWLRKTEDGMDAITIASAAVDFPECFLPQRPMISLLIVVFLDSLIEVHVVVAN